MKVKVIFSLDATGLEHDITEIIDVPSKTCLYCLHDKTSRLFNVIIEALTNKGYDTTIFFQVMKIYVV